MMWQRCWETGWTNAEECQCHGHDGALPLSIGPQLSVRPDSMRIKSPDRSPDNTSWVLPEREIVSPIQATQPKLFLIRTKAPSKIKIMFERVLETL